MKKYNKPEIKVNYFETNDVIATSCTCPSYCICQPGNQFVATAKELYFHDVSELNTEAPGWGNFFYSNTYLAKDLYCPEHGSIYYVEHRQYD